jgi:hypothetical protein
LRENTINADIDIHETLGDEVLVHLTLGEHKFQVSLDPHACPVFKGSLEICPIMSRSHIFDADTGENLTLPDFVKNKNKEPAAV